MKVDNFTVGAYYVADIDPVTKVVMLRPVDIDERTISISRKEFLKAYSDALQEDNAAGVALPSMTPRLATLLAYLGLNR